MEIGVSRGDGAGAVIAITGEIDVSHAATLRRTLLAEIAGPATSVTVDLTGVTFLDSSGISVLIAGHNAATEAGVPYLVTGVTGRVAHVLTITGVINKLTEGTRPEPS
ncbi:STAS domain-containing protein [Rhizomonospora bruguierae]|uniref:STAS domain-containing protein n=1 Tax=Rhizomonospora bruguierae TaxID=1581705 RepID=UPI001BCBF319|nr:STAS domain-containing protein [Micromonospora sp. NBRC 107566]